MNRSTTYETAAHNWSNKASRLGYVDAYADFLEQSVLASGSVLDVGAGTGTFSLSWIEAGGSKDLTLLDPSPAMLAQARAHFAQRHLSPKLVNSDFESFDSHETFDAILASHVLEHFKDPSHIMRRLNDHLAPGGRLYLNVSKPHWCNWLIWTRFRHRWFKPEAICEMAQNAGLTKLRIHKFRSGPPSRTSLGYIFFKP
jgi:demethylmenaquinone methyltransferase/2-methoxy-6-polyprenyl-1,4-benzoquinol methylase